MDKRLICPMLAMAFLLTIVAPLLADPAMPACVRLNVDEFKGRTTVELKPQYVYKDAGFLAAVFDAQVSMFFVVANDSIYAPDSVQFALIHPAGVRHGVSNTEADWAFTREADHELNVIVDGIHRSLGPMRYMRGSEANTFLAMNRLSLAHKWIAPEVFVVTLPTLELTGWINAQACAGQVDGLRFFLQNKRQGTLDKYRAFAAYLVGLPKATSSAN